MHIKNFFFLHEYHLQKTKQLSILFGNANLVTFTSKIFVFKLFEHSQQNKQNTAANMAQM